MKFLLDSQTPCQGVPTKSLVARAFRLAEDIEPKHARAIARSWAVNPI
jgi:hypothetical protein